MATRKPARIAELESWTAWLMALHVEALIICSRSPDDDPIVRVGEDRWGRTARELKIGQRFEKYVAYLKTARKARLAGARAHPEEPTTTPEDTLRDAGISSKRQAKYQRRMSALLARRT
jgi:hypothetical protein